MEKTILLRAQDCVLRGFGHAEFHNALGGNLNGRARGRIAAHARGPINQDELAQAREGESVFGVLVSELANAFQNLGGLLLGESVFLGDGGGDL